MTKNSRDALSRSDRVLVGALAIVLAATSAAVGAAAAYNPHTDQVKVEVVKVPTAVPVPAPARISVKAAATDVVLAKLLAEHRCLSEVMYYEARGEGVEGEKAIAEVVFHRMNHGNYGHSICAVVYEGSGKPGCQFSFVCSGEMANRKSPGAWREAQLLAAEILTGEVRLVNATGGATNFHAVSVQPDWSGDLVRTVQIGNHVFYRSGPRPHANSDSL